MTIEPIEHVPDDIDPDLTDCLKAFEVGRAVGALSGVNDDNFYRGYSEGLAAGFKLGQMSDDEREDVVRAALGGDTMDRPATPAPYRAPRFHETWELHPHNPIRGRRTRRPGRVR